MNTQNNGSSTSQSNQGSQNDGKGFASMDPQKRQEAASKGGQTTAQNYDMSERGRKGGQARSENSGSSNAQSQNDDDR